MELPEIKEYGEAKKLIGDVSKELEQGNIMSVMILCERTDGTMYGGTTSTQNMFAVAGYMMAWAMSRMYFVNAHMFKDKLQDDQG